MTVFGGDSEEVTPVPFPNTEVKLFSADGTAWATEWESRTPPNFFKARYLNKIRYRAFFWGKLLTGGSRYGRFLYPRCGSHSVRSCLPKDKIYADYEDSFLRRSVGITNFTAMGDKAHCRKIRINLPLASGSGCIIRIPEFRWWPLPWKIRPR